MKLGICILFFRSCDRCIKCKLKGVVYVLDTREKLTTKAAASYLNVAEVTIHKYVKDGLLEPAYKNWLKN